MPLISPEIRNIIVEAAKKNELVIFVGAGASIEMVSVNWDELTKKLADSIDQNAFYSNTEREYIKNLTKGDPLPTLSYLCGINKQPLQDQFWKIFPPQRNSYNPTKITRLIMKLNTSRFITTNYDYCLEAAAEELEKKINIIMNYKNIDFGIFEANGNQSITHIHGEASNKIDDIVLTEAQYTEAYGGGSNLVTFMESLLENYFVLFVGFSFDDKDIRRILSKYSVYGSRTSPKHHLAIFKREDATQEKIQRDMMINNYNLKTIFYDATKGEDEHAQLLPLLEELVDMLEVAEYIEDKSKMAVSPK